MTLPVLPNRIPIASLPAFSSSLPLGNLNDVVGLQAAVAGLNGPLACANLLANLSLFMPAARFSLLPTPNLRAYLELINVLVSRLPPTSLETAPAPSQPAASAEDSDDDYGVIADQTATVTGSLLRQLDSKAISRLTSLLAPSYLKTLLGLADKAPIVYAIVVNMSAVWPNSQRAILRTIVLHGGSKLVNHLWRESVRPSSIGRDIDLRLLTDASLSQQWPPLVLLLQAYTQMLLTMGDEEFFSAPGAPRNALSLAEVTELAYRALRVAFMLFWNEDQADVKDGFVPGLAVRWESIRTDATAFLQSVHAREYVVWCLCHDCR